MTSQETETSLASAPPHISESRRFFRVFFSRKIVVFGLVVIIALAIMAIFANILAPYDPYKQDLTNIAALPSHDHLLGTDSIGRDILSRVIFGSRTAFLVGIVGVCLAATIGVTLGLIAGYFGGIVNTIIMRLTEVLMAFPMIVLALSLASILGPGIQNVVIALGIANAAGYIRVMNGMTMSLKENDYILAGKSMGSSGLRIMLRHILPNSFAPIIVVVTLQIGFMILAEASLSYLGIGIQPPSAAWGAMVAEGYRYLTSNPVLSFAPGIAIMLVVFAFNLVGDGLRDALDPRLRGLI